VLNWTRSCSLSDRIAVMFDGTIMGFRDPETTDERDLGLLMAGIAEGSKGEAA
jgi:general nucleoside transport system ATP-binding protein